MAGLQASKRFCAGILAADQRAAYRRFAISGGPKFDGLDWTSATSGSPRLGGTPAWVDCDIVAVHDGGDHEIRVERGNCSLIFFRRGHEIA
ncbi:flavin reductase family protein [Streptosporangium sp. NPDC001681]|uniref:flavin reductase family protein n=1 Tax=Streptosporangium sp. NPDC001681 TaxID=3154395 RepID=UPI003327D618